MNSLVNRVHLIGTLGKDPEVKEFESGKKRVSFSIATNEYYKNDKGDKVEMTEWHNIIAWGRLGDFCAEYLKKGKKIALQGKLTSRSYDDKEGVKKYVTEVNAQDVLLLSAKEPANS